MKRKEEKSFKVIENGITNKANANKLSVAESLQIMGGAQNSCAWLVPCGTGNIRLCPNDEPIVICMDIKGSSK
jgi:hypothetical protein